MRNGPPPLVRLLYAITIACSASLLFLVQPMIAKRLLPWFGGSAGVWVACMLFFQVVLLAGYGYSYGVTRRLSRRGQGWLHAALLLLSLWAIPLRPRVLGNAAPALAILALLSASVGLPYFVLSTTSPLLQSWYAGSGAGQLPYRLFALSNAASLAALIAYPVVIEPVLPVERQLRWWSGAYLLFVLLAGVLALRSVAWRPNSSPLVPGPPNSATRLRPLMWIALSACASVLWLAVANHLSQEVAAVPFLWVFPLSLYLLSFILCFESSGWYRPSAFRWLLPAAWAAMCWRIALPGTLRGELTVFPAALLICCIFCHGELARGKPELMQPDLKQPDLKPGLARQTHRLAQQTHGLAFFYLMIALGGALGAVFVALAAPNLFSTYLELPIGITACIFLALVLLYGYTARRLARLAAVAVIAFVFATRYQAAQGGVVRLRNFYGALQVTDSGTGEQAVRSLYNGRTLHGLEFLSAARRRLATAYYGPESGAGLVLSRPAPARRVGIIGLGAGTLALYGHRGDEFRYYEINPAVMEVASEYFHLLRDAEAKIDLITGDGRLALEREPSKSFDVIVLDAFSDDSIPVHLLTREAFEIYFQRLRDGGLLLIHLTNRYLELDSVVRSIADSMGKQSAVVHSAADRERQLLAADWMVVAGDRDALQVLLRGRGVPARRKSPVWTDEYSNLFGIWK